MRFPNYTGYPQPNRPLIDSYIKLLADAETRERSSLDASRHTALAIGRACVRITQNDHEIANRELRLVQFATEPFKTAAITALERRQRLNHRVAHLILSRNNPPAINKIRRTIHNDVIRDIYGALGDFRDDRSGDYRERRLLAGQVIDKTVTGLFTRLAHPWLLAIPTLIHQDRTHSKYAHKITGNFDTTLVHTGPYQPKNRVCRVQTKLGCIGLCEEGVPIRKGREVYAPNITLASGCCDLGVTLRGQQLHSPATTLLLKESEDRATPTELLELDAIGSSLLLDFTRENNGRQGTWAPTETPASAVLS